MNSAEYRYNLIKALAFVVIFMFNQTFANHLELFNVAPNFIFVLLLSSSLIENKNHNVYYAFAFGLLFDFFNGKILGVYTLLFVGISFVLSEFYHTYFENMTSVQTAFSVLGCLFYSLLQAIFFGLKDGVFFSVLFKVSLIEFVYNALLSVVMTVLYKKILNMRKSAWRI